jgi:hypothetical protein
MPRGLRKFTFSFEKTGLTRWGGLSLFALFCKSLGLRHYLQLYVRWPPYHHRAYHPADLFLAHMFALVTGIGRVENTQSLIHNGLIPPLLGLPEFPHRDTLRTFLWRFNQKHLRSLEAAHDKLRTEFFQRLGLLYSATIDADTTTMITHGHQEGVALGYIPKRRHRSPSYAPILSSEGHMGFSLGMELRAGDVHASTGAWIFLRSILDKLPSSIAASRTRVRLDGAFYDRDIIRSLDGDGLGYVIVAKMKDSLKKRMIAAKYHEFASGWEAAEFTYPLIGFTKEHRFVAVRRPQAVEPEEVQKRLFTFKQHTYHRALVVGNLDLTAEGAWRFYCDRAFQELLIREFKDSLFMAQIPTRSFWANAAYMEMILWAYDFVLAFQALCLPKEVQHWNISTLRRELWWLPAECIRKDNRNLLMLPVRYPQQELFFKIQKAASKIRPLL